MKEEGNTNGASECHKFLSKKIFNLLDSGGDDDSEDEQPEKTVKQIVTDEERDKVDVPRCEDFIDDFAIPQCKIQYEDYRIVGDVAEVEKVIQTCGMINIGVADITSTLSTDTVNYVTVGIGGNIMDAMERSVGNLPITAGQVGKMLLQILIPKDYKPDISAIESMTDFIGKYNKDADVCWGLAFDESLIDNIKVILIASSK